MLEFKVTGLERVKQRLKDISEEIGRKVIDKACRAAALYFAREAKARCNNGDVIRSIKVIRLPGENTPKQFTYLVSAGKYARVAHLLEFGTKPHEIKPNLKNRAAKNYVSHHMNAAGETVVLEGPQAPGATGALVKVIHRGGATISERGRMALRIDSEFVAGVIKHPGAKKKPFMRPAFDEASNAALDAYVRSAEENFRRLERAGDLSPNWGGGF